MTTSNAHSNDELRDALYSQLKSARSLDDLRVLLSGIEQHRDAIGLEHSAELARITLANIASVTIDKPADAADVICKSLLPWCFLQADSEEPSSKVDLETSKLRGLLRTWVYQYPSHEIVGLRSEVLQEIQERLAINPTKELLWTIGAIGYRSPDLTAMLWTVMQKDDSIADSVRGTLAGLGCEPKDRERLLDIVNERLEVRELTPGILIAVQELVGPHRMDIALKMLTLAVAMYPREDHADFASAVNAATRAVQRCPEDQASHQTIWEMLRLHGKTVRMSSNYAYRCDTQGTIGDHVNWMLVDSNENSGEVKTYTGLSRLRELVTPQQLAGWDGVKTFEFFELLKRYCQTDTRMVGKFATTSLHLKNAAWETALMAGAPVEKWLEAAVMGETNAYAAHDVCKILSCLRIDRLPESLLRAIVEAERFNEDDERLFRQRGLIEVARSSGSCEAFEALLHFGFTIEDEVLLSTIDAITDVAIYRLNNGDQDVYERVLAMTMIGNQKSHRDGAIAAFCRMATCGHVHGDWLRHLWDFVTSDGMDAYSRCAALEAIAHTKSKETDEWAESIRQIAKSDESDVGWRACEAMILRDWLTTDDESWIFQRLGVIECDSKLELADPATYADWQAFVGGLLFQKDQSRFCNVVSGILEYASTACVFQVLPSLRHHGADCPENVSDALERRIRMSNERGSTNTEFFSTLGAISPSRLLTLSMSPNLRDWLVEGRTALCEAIRSLAINDEECRIEALDCLVPMMRDAAFQVRRSAYRAVAEVDVHSLELVCEPWSKSADIELCKRAAEAVAWLPISSYPDEVVLEFGFAWDAEPSVRGVWKDVLVSRRERSWAKNYLDSILSSSPSVTSESYRYGRALAKLGDDDSIRRIDEFLTRQGGNLPPNVRHWLKKIASDIRSNWRKKTLEWPEPWSHETGTIEKLTGNLVFKDGKQLKVQLSLWCRHRSGPSDLGEWGGSAEDLDRKIPFHLDACDEVEIRISGRESAMAQVSQSHWASTTTKLVLRGTGPYPNKLRPQYLEGGLSLVDLMANIFEDTGITLPDEDAPESARQLQLIIERVDLALLGYLAERDVAIRRKLLAQGVAVLARSVAELLPPKISSAVALWRIANAILERESLTLRLSPEELAAFGEIARRGEPDTPDDLLLWILDHVTIPPMSQAQQEIPSKTSVSSSGPR